MTRHLESQLGAFARIFTCDSPADLAQAFVDHQLTQVQLNLTALGYPTVPSEEQRTLIDLDLIAREFTERGRVLWGVSATYNMAHPDDSIRRSSTARAATFIRSLAGSGAVAVTLCSGTSDPVDMWALNPNTASHEAWARFRESLDVLLPAARDSGLFLGIEPEPHNVVSDTSAAVRLFSELGDDGEGIGVILDPANLVSATPRDDHPQVLDEAFAELGSRTICLHAKDTLPWSQSLAGSGVVDFGRVGRLYAELPAEVPVIIQDAPPGEVDGVRDMLHARFGPSAV